MALEEEKCERYGMHHDGDRPCYQCMWDELQEYRKWRTSNYILDRPDYVLVREIALADLLVVCEAWAKKIQCNSTDTANRFDYEMNLFIDKWFPQ